MEPIEKGHAATFNPAAEPSENPHGLQLAQELDGILASACITSLFQPIVTLSTLEVFGYESLSRGPSDSTLHNPIPLFEVARRTGRTTELDLLCRRRSIAAFAEQALGGRLFLNATPQSLMDVGHRSGLTLEALHHAGVNPDRVVIELTEQHPGCDLKLMEQALSHYRSMGFRIAIDDLGAGYSSLRRWSTLSPEFVKIDRHFIEGIDRDRTKRTFVTSIIELADDLHCTVVAEGIETAEELHVLQDIGVRLGQGYLFDRPREHPTRTPEFHTLSRPVPVTPVRGHSVLPVDDLIQPSPRIEARQNLESVYRIFMDDENLSAIAVVDSNDSPIGLLRRSELLTTFSSQYGRALHGHKPALALTDESAVRVERSWDIERISALVSRNMQSRIEAEFLVVDNGRYYGLGKVIDLLKMVTETQIRNARHANPLTGLPGNVPIYERLDRAIARSEPIAVAYLDLDNFKPFNDVYGYARGDAVIRLLADITQECIAPGRDFLGHVGGDDFIVVFVSDTWRSRCERMLKLFRERVVSHYRPEDQRNGGLHGLSRDGTPQFFPFVSLSIGALVPETARMLSHEDIADRATKAKHKAKEIASNSLYIVDTEAADDPER